MRTQSYVKRTFSFIAVLVIALVLFVAFFLINRNIEAQKTELSNINEQSQLELADVKSEQTTLKSTLDTVDTDAFVESQARSLYGYINEDEIRLVVTNPESLYGNDLPTKP